jgi:hypothetical protein
MVFIADDRKPYGDWNRTAKWMNSEIGRRIPALPSGERAKVEDIFDGIYRMDGIRKGRREGAPASHYAAMTATHGTEKRRSRIHRIVSILFILSEKNTSLNL